MQSKLLGSNLTGIGGGSTATFVGSAPQPPTSLRGYSSPAQSSKQAQAVVGDRIDNVKSRSNSAKSPPLNLIPAASVAGPVPLSLASGPNAQYAVNKNTITGSGFNSKTLINLMKGSKSDNHAKAANPETRKALIYAASASAGSSISSTKFRSGKPSFYQQHISQGINSKNSPETPTLSEDILKTLPTNPNPIAAYKFIEVDKRVPQPTSDSSETIEKEGNIDQMSIASSEKEGSFASGVEGSKPMSIGSVSDTSSVTGKSETSFSTEPEGQENVQIGSESESIIANDFPKVNEENSSPSVDTANMDSLDVNHTEIPCESHVPVPAVEDSRVSTSLENQPKRCSESIIPPLLTGKRNCGFNRPVTDDIWSINQIAWIIEQFEEHGFSVSGDDDSDIEEGLEGERIRNPSKMMSNQQTAQLLFMSVNNFQRVIVQERLGWSSLLTSLLVKKISDFYHSAHSSNPTSSNVSLIHTSKDDGSHCGSEDDNSSLNDFHERPNCKKVRVSTSVNGEQTTNTRNSESKHSQKPKTESNAASHQFPSLAGFSSSGSITSDISLRKPMIGATLINCAQFLFFWEHQIAPYDRTERLFRLFLPIGTKTTPNREYLVPDDFLALVQEVIRHHPSLYLLQENNDYQQKYLITVITRIFYLMNSSRTGKITLREFRYWTHSLPHHQTDIILSDPNEGPGIPSTLSTSAISFESILNQIDPKPLKPSTEEIDIDIDKFFFSYKHFYVLMCTFLDLDNDQDGVLHIKDFQKYNRFALTPIMVNR